jgi:hypothetical protein
VELDHLSALRRDALCLPRRHAVLQKAVPLSVRHRCNVELGWSRDIKCRIG